MTGSRDPSIDVLRVAALFGCIAIHAAVPLVSAPVPELLWPVRQAPGSWVADLVFWWGRCAQPQLFFLLAGMVSAEMLAARGPAAFATARLRRIGVPFLAGVVFVLPLVGAIWAWGWLDSGRVTWAEVRSWRFSDPEIARNSLGPAHLWFLQDLLIMSLMFAAWSLLAARAGWRAIRLSGATLAGLALVGWTILVLSPAMLFAVPNTFVPDVRRIVFGATFFAAGVCVARDRQALRQWPHASLLLCGAVAAAVVMVRLLSGGTAWATPTVALASSAIATSWFSVLGSLKLVEGRAFVLPPLVQRLAGSPARQPRWGALAASTYPIYVLHLPIVGATQLLLLPHVSHTVLAMALVWIATLSLTWLLIEAGRRGAAVARTVGDRLERVPIAAWTIAAIVFGVGLRVLQYARNPDVWHDEAALLVNVIERGYASLLTPLTYNEAAPPLFLWLERWMATSVSDSTWMMRLVPLAASCAALVAFLPMSGVITRRMVPVAVLLMAASIKVIGHSAEAKPYTLDVLLATAAASLFVLTTSWSLARRALLFTLVAPLLVWATYPGVFVIGGVAGALALDAWREKRVGLPFAAFAVITGVSVALLVAGPVHAQRSTEILDHWSWAFPDSSNPLALAVWGARSIVGIADYCFRPFGGVLLIPIAVGVGALVRQGRLTFVVLLTLPLILAAVAGLAGQYPFSGTRVMVFALPALAVLAAEGLETMLARTPAKSMLLRTTVLAIALLPPLVMCAREVIAPSRRPDTAAATSFVLAARRPADVVVADHWEYRYYLRHLGASFVPLGERPWPTGQDRLWCILHGTTAEARHARLVAFVGSSYDIVRAEDLYGVSVMELSARR